MRARWDRCALLWLAAVGCAAGEDAVGGDDHHGDDSELLDDASKADSSGLVQDHVRSSCSTAVVHGLSTQIAREMTCMASGSMLEEVAPGGNIKVSGAHVLLFLDPAAAAGLRAVADKTSIEINSGFRTVAQQYLIHRWARAGRCRISRAAPPGDSNHESGRALDVANYRSIRKKLKAAGWSQTVPGDPVHFDFLMSPDLRGADIHAFQRLWNRNHPDDPVDEDGDYGGATEKRLAMSPAAGFPIGPCAGELERDDGDPALFVADGPWQVAADLIGFRGNGYRVLPAGATGEAVWFVAPQPGRFELVVSLPRDPPANPRALYRVRTSDADPGFEIEIDQRPGGEIRLGEFDLEATAEVSVRAAGASAPTIADAIVLRPAVAGN